MEKCRVSNLTVTKTNTAIDLIWDANKLAKLQFFTWQVASGGLFIGSRAIYMGHPGECIQCRSGLLKTTEHCLSFYSFSRRAWQRARSIRRAFGLGLILERNCFWYPTGHPQ